jgi:hypothetical protein
MGHLQNDYRFIFRTIHLEQVTIIISTDAQNFMPMTKI